MPTWASLWSFSAMSVIHVVHRDCDLGYKRLVISYDDHES